VTIEDPIEYELRYINQTQINPKAGIDFALGLRAFLRHDPNIIMVGEIRDPETAGIATNAALTGHLVLSTLHTNDAPAAIPRLIDMGVEAFLVAATVNIVVAQRLVRKICSDCIESIEVTEAMKELMLTQLKISSPTKVEFFVMPTTLYHGKGCSVCNWRGYKGRIGMFEFFEVTPDLRDYIVGKYFTLDGLKAKAIAQGMETMFEDGLSKARLGLTTVEEVMRVIRE
jgi:type II secretory ATPase GspE/PulE/Tfp pilus assembly ATPase PilB-like protein